jgi:hypothetical protein
MKLTKNVELTKDQEKLLGELMAIAIVAYCTPTVKQIKAIHGICKCYAKIGKELGVKPYTV